MKVTMMTDIPVAFAGSEYKNGFLEKYVMMGSIKCHSLRVTDIFACLMGKNL